MKGPLTIAFPLALACASCANLNEPGRLEELIAAYESDDPQSDIRLEFYPTHYLLTTAGRDLSVPSQSDSGGESTRVETDGVTYLRNLPVFAPGPGTARWRLNGFDCQAREGHSQVEIDCKLGNREFHSLFDRSVGVRELDFHCGRYTNELCRYRLVTSRGVLAP